MKVGKKKKNLKKSVKKMVEKNDQLFFYYSDFFKKIIIKNSLKSTPTHRANEWASRPNHCSRCSPCGRRVLRDSSPTTPPPGYETQRSTPIGVSMRSRLAGTRSSPHQYTDADALMPNEIIQRILQVIFFLIFLFIKQRKKKLR